MSNRKILLNQITLYFVVFIGLAFTYTQVIPFLTYIGYTPIERGMILSAIAVVAIIGQFYVGYLCDKYNTIKKFYNILTVIYVISNALMFAYTENSFFIHLLLVALTGGLFRVVAGLLETWTIETNEYMKNHFGTIRAFGAIGWAIGSPLTSAIINRFGYSAIGFAFAIIILISHVISYTLPDAQKIEKNTNLRIVDIKVLLQNKNYVKLVVMLIFVNIVFTADMYTVIDKIIHIGGTNDEIAFKWSFQAVTELPLFFMGFYLLKKFNANRLLIFSIIMFIIRFLLYTVAITPMQIILISGMQSVTFPLLMIAQKVLISDESPANLQSTGQMFALSLYVGLSALITPVLSGFLVEMFGYDITLLIMTVSLLVPLWLAISYLRSAKLA
jgi:MFS family permease